ncbi:MAG: hypothetical protein ACK5MR_15255 [Cumulibacter sp.]
MSVTTTSEDVARVRHAADDLRAAVAESVARIDGGDAQTTERLADLGGRGLLDLGIDSIADPLSAEADVAGSAELIALLAEECMSSAFSLWAHRMVLDFFARGARNALNNATLAGLRSGELIGSSAMAAGMKALAGIEPLGITGRVERTEIVIDGQIRWASNLVPGAVIVLPVALDDGRRVVLWARVGDAGLDVRYVEGLLALNATASGSVSLSGVRISTDAVLSWTFADSARAYRPTFLALQSAFCVGISRRSAREADVLIERPGNEGLVPRYEAVCAQVVEIEQRWRQLSTALGSATPRDFVQLRLDASVVAGEATRLEATLAGGRGYVAASGPSRRFREAAFLPVQSPSEGQLRWELASLDS